MAVQDARETHLEAFVRRATAEGVVGVMHTRLEWILAKVPDDVARATLVEAHGALSRLTPYQLVEPEQSERGRTVRFVTPEAHARCQELRLFSVMLAANLAREPDTAKAFAGALADTDVAIAAERMALDESPAEVLATLPAPDRASARELVAEARANHAEVARRLLAPDAPGRRGILPGRAQTALGHALQAYDRNPRLNFIALVEHAQPFADQIEGGLATTVETMRSRPRVTPAAQHQATVTPIRHTGPKAV